MKNTAYPLIIGFCLLLTFGAGLALANEPLGKEALETAIKGNTVEGRFLKWKTTFKMYYDPSGKFRRIDSLNNKEGGSWSIDAKGVLLMSGRKDRYRTVKQRDDGGC